jgi:hypothetical protein
MRHHVGSARSPRKSRALGFCCLGWGTILGLGLIAPPLQADGPVRAWGMGGALTSAARGLEAVSWNPANLALADSGWSLGLVSAAVDLSNNSFSLARYNEISGGRLDQADKEDILADIPGDGLRMNSDVQASLLGARIGSWALTFQALGSGGGRLDKKFIDLVLMGNEVGQEVSFSHTNGEAYALAAATLSHARTIWSGDDRQLCVGVNLRFLRGLYEIHVTEATGELTTTLTEVSGSARAAMTSASGGHGLSCDIGLAWQAPGGWEFGLTLDHALSRMNWDHDPERRLWSVAADTLNLDDEDWDSAIVDNDTTTATGSYRTVLPRRLRLGGSRRFGGWLLAADVAQGLQNRAGVTTQPILGLGAEFQNLTWLKPRFGCCFGGPGSVGVAVGAGFRAGPWRLDLAALNRGTLWPGTTRGLALAAGTSLAF